MKIDDASWHYEAEDFPEDLPNEAASTHIGVYFAWAALNFLIGEAIEVDWTDQLKSLREKMIHPGEFIFSFMGGVISDIDFNKQGVDFSTQYYARANTGYLSIYESIGKKISGQHSEYYTPDNWKTFEIIAPLIDKEYQAWLLKTK